jgi:hypothetical protein
LSRHSAAKLRRDADELVEEVSRFLDHSNLAVTASYCGPRRARRKGVGEASGSHRAVRVPGGGAPTV